MVIRGFVVVGIIRNFLSGLQLFCILSSKNDTPSSFDKKNAAYFGKGMAINKFTGSRGKSGSNDANAEFVASIRNLLDNNKVMYQFSELGKVEQLPRLEGKKMFLMMAPKGKAGK